MQIVFIPPPRAPADASTTPVQKPSGQHAVPRRPASSISAKTQPAAPTEDESNAIHAPIDWAAELSQAANTAAAESAQTPRDFGFPHLPAAPKKPPPFEWDYAATHRVEQIDGGGLLVHLNDQCVLVLFPLPFMGCALGTKPANGELFKDMGTPAQVQPGTAP